MINYENSFGCFITYTRLKANGKHSTVAQIAVMRKLIVIAYYDTEVYKKACGVTQIKNENKEVAA